MGLILEVPLSFLAKASSYIGCTFRLSVCLFVCLSVCPLRFQLRRAAIQVVLSVCVCACLSVTFLTSQDCLSKLSLKIVLQKCLTEMSYRNVLQKCLTEMSYRIVLQKCLTELSYRIVLQNCLTELSFKILVLANYSRSFEDESYSSCIQMSLRNVPENCPTEMSNRNVQQKCPTEISTLEFFSKFQKNLYLIFFKISILKNFEVEV